MSISTFNILNNLMKKSSKTYKTKSHKRHVVMLSNSVTSSDPRVKKWAKTLNDSGWRVTTIGVENNNSAKSEHNFSWRQINVANAKNKLNHQVPIWEKALSRIGKDGGLARRIIYYFGLRYGIKIYSPGFLWCFKDSNPIYSNMKNLTQIHVHDVDLWIANDWDMLPLVSELRDKIGGKILYDSHEFASEQFLNDKHWRKWQQPLIKAIERKYITHADIITTVSDGLCHSLASTYNLTKYPICIRNIPEFLPITSKKLNSPIQVLYQGVIMPGRGIEALIESVAYWTFDGKLIIRGPHYNQSYFDKVRALAKSCTMSNKITFEAAVAPSKMIEAASFADIGVMFLDSKSKHNRYALPNKLFEYIMAGLCICVSNLPDMAKIVKEYNLGLLVDNLTSQDIAKSLNNIGNLNIDKYKYASHQAAKDLNWEIEKDKLLKVIESIISNGKN